MGIIEWNDDFGLGIDELDRDHIMWIDMYNALYRAAQAGTDKSTLMMSFDELLSHTRFHFINEDAFMEEKGLEGAREHKAEHAKMLRQMNELRKGLQEAKTQETIIETLIVLRDWLVQHILESDRELT